MKNFKPTVVLKKYPRGFLGFSGNFGDFVSNFGDFGDLKEIYVRFCLKVRNFLAEGESRKFVSRDFRIENNTLTVSLLYDIIIERAVFSEILGFFTLPEHNKLMYKR